jgi:hypothetical protein
MCWDGALPSACGSGCDHFLTFRNRIAMQDRDAAPPFRSCRIQEIILTDNLLPPALTRRDVMAGALGTAALAFAVPGLAHTPGRRPNFLFIMADDLGYADLSCYGRREYTTPVLDSLAAQGMKFTHGYANSAVCSATRVGLITGRYQYRTPAGLEEPLQNPDLGLDPAHPTLPSLLRHRAIIRRWWASGISACCRTTARCRAVMTSSGAIAAAEWTISPTASAAARMCGTAM